MNEKLQIRITFISLMIVFYWSEHIEKWDQTLNQPQENNFSSKNWFSWSEIVGADVAGAVRAAVTVVIVNAVLRATQVA